MKNTNSKIESLNNKNHTDGVSHDACSVKPRRSKPGTRNSEPGTFPCSRPRVGKIAQLPYEITEELNASLREGEESDVLLDWLNSLEEVQQVLNEYFDGKPINKQNLSDWRQGGYAEWLLKEELAEQASALQNQA